MEWLYHFLTHDPLIITILIGVIVSIFIYAAHNAHIKHLDRIKKIDEIYKPKISSSGRR